MIEAKYTDVKNHMPDLVMYLPHPGPVRDSIENEALALLSGIEKLYTVYISGQKLGEKFTPAYKLEEAKKALLPAIDAFCLVATAQRKNIAARLANTAAALDRKINPRSELSDIEKLLLHMQQSEIRTMLSQKPEKDVLFLLSKEVERGEDVLLSALKSSPVPTVDSGLISTMEKSSTGARIEKYGAEQEQANCDLMTASACAFNVLLDGCFNQARGWLAHYGLKMSQEQTESFRFIILEN